MEPNFLVVWQELRKALAHRNNILKSGCSSNELNYWDKMVSEKSHEMDLSRKQIVDKLNNHLRSSSLSEDLGGVCV